MNYAAVNLRSAASSKAEEAYRDGAQDAARTTTTRTSGSRSRSAARSTTRTSTRSRGGAARARRVQEARRRDRAETYYNEAILTQEYKAKGGGHDAEPSSSKAEEHLRDVHRKAGGNAEYADAVKRSKERMQDIDRHDQVHRGRARRQQKAAEADAKSRPPRPRRRPTTPRRRRQRRQGAPPAGGATPPRPPAPARLRAAPSASGEAVSCSNARESQELLGARCQLSGPVAPAESRSQASSSTIDSALTREPLAEYNIL